MAGDMLILRLRRMALAPLPLKGVRGRNSTPPYTPPVAPAQAGAHRACRSPQTQVMGTSLCYCDGVFLRGVISAVLLCAA
jgi:hypothetical protein